MDITQILLSAHDYKRMFSRPNYTRESVSNAGSDIARQFLESSNLPFGGKDEYGLDVRRLVETLGGRIQTVHCDEFLEMGSIYVHGDRDFDVLVPFWTSYMQDVFAVAMALGHYFLHYKPSQGKRYYWRKCRSHMHNEAIWFAYGFLMPAELIARNKFHLKDNYCKCASYFNVVRSENLDSRLEMYRKYNV